MRNIDLSQNKVNQIVLASLFSLTIGLVNIYGLSSWKELVLIGLIIIGVMVFMNVAKAVFQLHISLPIFFLYLLIASFFIGPGLLSIQIGPIGIFPFRLFLAVMGVWFLISIVKQKHILQNEHIFVKHAIYFFVIWVAYGMISLLWVKSIPLGIKDLIFLISGISTILFTVYFFYKERNYLIFFYIWLGAVVLFILLGFWNHLTHQHLPISRLANAPDYIKGRPSAVFTNENDFASFMSIGLFFGFALFNHAKKFIYKLVGLSITVSGLYLIMVSTSRASIIAVLLGFVFWFLFLTRNKQKFKVLGIGALSGFLATILFLEKVSAAIGTLFQELTSVFGSPDVEEASVDIRRNLLRNGLEFLQNTYGAGIGAGNAEYYIKNHSLFPTFGQTNVHNWWAEIAINYGLLIFTCYILVYIGIIIKLYRINKQTEAKQVKLITEALLIGLIVFVIASISPSSVMTLSYTWLLFAFSLGYLNFMHMNNKMHEGDFNNYEWNN